MKPGNARRQRSLYESWVFSRVSDKKALCHLYRGHRCVPSHDESCRSCYLQQTLPLVSSGPPAKAKKTVS